MGEISQKINKDCIWKLLFDSSTFSSSISSFVGQNLMRLSTWSMSNAESSSARTEPCKNNEWEMKLLNITNNSFLMRQELTYENRDMSSALWRGTKVNYLYVNGHWNMTMHACIFNVKPKGTINTTPSILQYSPYFIFGLSRIFCPKLKVKKRLLINFLQYPL